jgi:AAA domain
MEKPLIDIHDGGLATIFWHGNEYKRVPDGESGFGWRKQTEDGPKSVGKSKKRLFDWTYKNPEAAEKLRRFPRLPKNKTSVPIMSFFDIPLTTDLPMQKTQWLVDRLIPEAELILITGLPGSYKSLLVEYLAAVVSEGKGFLGRTTRRTRVLILDRDNPSHIIAQRREMLNMSESGYLRIWGNWAEETPPGIDDPRLEEFARDHHLLIIFDSLVRFHDADENSIKEMAAIMAKLRKLVTAGATVIVLHHSPKSEHRKIKYRGASDIHAGVDVAFNLSVVRKTNPPTLTFECFKHRGMEEFTLTIRPDFQHGRFELVSDSSAQKSDATINKLKALIREEPGLCQEDLIVRSGLPEHKARDILNDWEHKLWKVEHPDRKKKTYFPLKDS